MGDSNLLDLAFRVRNRAEIITHNLMDSLEMLQKPLKTRRKRGRPGASSPALSALKESEGGGVKASFPR